LRKNHASARYRLWLAASLKFLIPFSLPVVIGRHLAWSSTETTARLNFAMDQVGRPLSQAIAPVSSGIFSSTLSPVLVRLLPVVLAAVWVCGLLAVLSVWYARWRKVSIAIYTSVPLLDGREVEALRRMETAGGMRKRRIEIRLSSASLEPGIHGIAHPVLVWPSGISEWLEDAHLDAIVAHELLHVRRRDNLSAVMHMAVEAVFWFHPLVWWVGARLVDERERACDEGVLELGSKRQVYAESILKTCEFCAGLRLACVSGVTGADLKQRIVRIMTHRVASRLDFGKKVLLSAAGLAAVAAPVVLGALSAAAGRAESRAEIGASGALGLEVVNTSPDIARAEEVLPVSKAALPKTVKCSKSTRVRRPVSFEKGRLERER